MSEILVTIEGQAEAWQEWVLPKGEAEYNKLSSRLKPIVRSLARRPVELTPVSKLVEYYDDIDKLTSDSDSGVLDSEAAKYLSRITKKVQELTPKTTEKGSVARELPLHIGAVYENGRNYLLVEHESIPTLDIKDEDNRRAYILENLHAFNTLFKQPQSWKPAVDLWLADAKFAAKAEGLSKEDFEAFSKQLKAMMAITASARAMEVSAGASISYLVALTGGERGNLDAQDTMSDFLLHADPEKLNEVINNPLVKIYYDRLMRDAGLINDEGHRWDRNLDDPSKIIDTSSLMEFIDESRGFRDRIREGEIKTEVEGGKGLVYYLENDAREGGFDTYIKEVLLAEDSQEYKDELLKRGIEEDSRWEAAKLACDAFLVDLWTRWETAIDDTREVDKLKKLSPMKTWGGDPLKAIIKPTFLPRLKKVYTEKGDEVILDLTDNAFSPDDIFKGNIEDKRIVPSMVTNLKRFARYNEAVFTFFGGSMATSIPSWDRKTMEEDIPQVISLLTQLYGGTKGEDEDKDSNTGKHIVGAMAMRLLYIKALASAVETTKPGFGEKMQILFDPQGETRPFVGVMKHLYGAKLDGKSGFIQSLIGGRTRLVVKDNKFRAEEYYRKTWDVLQTNDETAGRKGAATLNKVGLMLDIAQSLAGAFAGYKKR